MSVVKILVATLALAVCAGALALGEERQSLAPGVADGLLRDEPLTIVFRRILEDPPLGAPWRWSWSVNSAGQAELTISRFPNPMQRKMEFSAKQMAGIRQVLRHEHFVELKDSYGPLVIHGGWSTLTVIAGEHINKTVRYNSTNWVNNWGMDKLAEAAPALRVWLKMSEIVDPEGKVFQERTDLAQLLKALKK
jgi:hypothetical protein